MIDRLLFLALLRDCWRACRAYVLRHWPWRARHTGSQIQEVNMDLQLGPLTCRPCKRDCNGSSAGDEAHSLAPPWRHNGRELKTNLCCKHTQTPHGLQGAKGSSKAGNTSGEIPTCSRPYRTQPRGPNTCSCSVSSFEGRPNLS